MFYLQRWWQYQHFSSPRYNSAKSFFKNDWYLLQYADSIATYAATPFIHFMLKGWKVHRKPHPLFDTRWYLEQNPDVREAGVNPLMHFLEFGMSEGRNPHPLFSIDYYLDRYIDLDGSEVNPVDHFLAYGAAEGRNPHPAINTNAYLAALDGSLEDRLAIYISQLSESDSICNIAVTRQRSRHTVSRRADRHFRHVVSMAKQRSLQIDKDVRCASQLISFVVPVFNTRVDYLEALRRSFIDQPTGTWEIVFSDDGSSSIETRSWLEKNASSPGINVIFNTENRGIASATNVGIGASSGKWVALLDHDDAITPHAILVILEALKGKPEALFLYTDEVITDENLKPVGYSLKPAWDPVLLSGVNYINHLSLYKRDRLVAIDGLRSGFQGSQDYDLLLRYLDGLNADQVIHLPFPAYMWRRDGVSYSAANVESSIVNARRAIAEAYKKPGLEMRIDCALSPDLHRVRFDGNIADWPLVSIVIPNKNSLPLISTLLEGLCQQTDYPSMEIIVVDNGTQDAVVHALYEQMADGPIQFKVLIEVEEFNFSRSVNKGIAAASGEFVLLLNNDIEVLDDGWLKEMVSCFDYDGVGIVGAKLLYPDRTIQHVGVIAGLGGLARHWFIGRDTGEKGPQGRLWVRQSLSVVTGACMLVSKACFDKVGVFDEDVFPIAYNDVDFCLRATKIDIRVLFTPFATLIHHKSAARGSDETDGNDARFARDKANLRGRHQTDGLVDRAYNPWYSSDFFDPSPVYLAEIPSAR